MLGKLAALFDGAFARDADDPAAFVARLNELLTDLGAQSGSQ